MRIPGSLSRKHVFALILFGVAAMSLSARAKNSKKPKKPTRPGITATLAGEDPPPGSAAAAAAPLTPASPAKNPLAEAAPALVPAVQKALPIKLYDVESPAWTLTLEPDGRVSMKFTQGTFMQGTGTWIAKGDVLTINRSYQQLADPTTGKPVKAAPSSNSSDYKLAVSGGALTIQNEKADAEGQFSIPPRYDEEEKPKE
jgi:hypothetical protein